MIKRGLKIHVSHRSANGRGVFFKEVRMKGDSGSEGLRLTHPYICRPSAPPLGLRLNSVTRDIGEHSFATLETTCFNTNLGGRGTLNKKLFEVGHVGIKRVSTKTLTNSETPLTVKKFSMMGCLKTPEDLNFVFGGIYLLSLWNGGPQGTNPLT